MNPKTARTRSILSLLLSHLQLTSSCAPRNPASYDDDLETMLLTPNLIPKAAILSYIKPTPPPHHPSFTITNVRIFDGTNILPLPHHVTISHGLITSLTPTIQSPPNDLPTISGQNRTLLPGLIDSHVHFTQESELDALIASGITSAFDMACHPASLLSTIRSHASSLDTVRPYIKSAGTPATTPDSTHARLLFAGEPSEIFLNYSAANETAMGEWIANRLAEGSDYVKIVADVPGPTQEMIDGLVRGARERGVMAMAHAASQVAWGMAVEGDADLITHVPLDGVVEDGVIRELVSGGQGGKGGGADGAERKVKAVVPTLTMTRAMARYLGGGNESFVEEVMGHALETVRKLHQAGNENGGLVILAGTDANNVPFASVKHGESLIEELELLVNGAGFEPIEALRSATSLPAEWWGLEGRGVVEVGAKADLLLVQGEPWGYVGVLRNVVGVWRDGRAALLKADWEE